MRSRLSTLIAAGVLCLVAVSCGSSDEPPGDEVDTNDKRAVALQCITEEEGLDARLVGDKSIQVGGPGGARVEFFFSSGEAESLQFRGEAQGAEHIGSSLLFVNRASDEELEKLERCLSGRD